MSEINLRISEGGFEIADDFVVGEKHDSQSDVETYAFPVAAMQSND